MLVVMAKKSFEAFLATIAVGQLNLLHGKSPLVHTSPLKVRQLSKWAVISTLYTCSRLFIDNMTHFKSAFLLLFYHVTYQVINHIEYYSEGTGLCPTCSVVHRLH